MRKTRHGLELASLLLAGLVVLREIFYYLEHRRSGPALELILLDAAVILLGFSSLLNRG